MMNFPFNSRFPSPARPVDFEHEAVRRLAFESSRGFTLIEILTTLAIVAVLASLLFGQLKSNVEKAKETQCLGKIKNIAAAINIAASDNGGSYPVISSDDPKIFPYIGDPATFFEPYLNTKDYKAWHCPSDPGNGLHKDQSAEMKNSPTRSYSFNSKFTVLKMDGSIIKMAAIPKASRTVLVCESWVGFSPGTSNGVSTGYPYDITGRATKSYVQKLHRKQDLSNYAFADGHVEMLHWNQVSPRREATRGMFAIDEAERDDL